MAEEAEEPVAICCTGATASRNYLPGLTEAFYRKLPVLAITATRRTRKEGDTLYTDCIPAERFADPVEIGQMAVMLASDMCNLVIGDTLYITGGSGTIKYR